MSLRKLINAGFPGGAAVYFLLLLLTGTFPAAVMAGPVYLPLIIKDSGQPIVSLQNGDFEKGPDGSWKESSSKGYPLIMTISALGLYPQGGSWAAWLGGLDGETSILSQVITVPSNATNLNFYYLILSKEGPATCGADLAYVKFDSKDLKPPYELCSNMTDWALEQIDISGYRGKTVELVFKVVNNNVRPSDFYLDTVSISH